MLHHLRDKILGHYSSLKKGINNHINDTQQNSNW